MKSYKNLLTIFFITCLSSIAEAQLPSGVENDFEARFNLIKINLTSIPLNNYSIQYERVLNKKSSIGFSFRFMPESKLPFRRLIRDAVADQDPELQRTVEQLRISNFAFTPEYRFYLGKGYGRGFYIAPFYRFANFKSNNILITYTADILGNEETINLSGDLSANTGGILFGAQWALSEYVSLDWMIAGPHFGGGNGNFDGVSSRPLSANEQQRVKQELESLDIPFTKKSISVNSQGANMKLDGPWGGIRTGISLGIRF